MINFSQRSDVVPSACILLSIIVLVGTLVYSLVIPVPSAAGVAASRAQSRVWIKNQVKSERVIAKQTQDAIKPRVWLGDNEAVTASVLGTLAQLARGHMATLNAFRPQKQAAIQEVTPLPFTTQITGTCHAIQALIRSLDSSGRMIVVQSVDISSSDENTGAVTATVGLSESEKYALTVKAKKQGLELTPFLPQGQTTLPTITELPFTAQITGVYPRVESILTALDSPSSKVILRSVQITSSDEKTDLVTATLGVSAYVVSDPSLARTLGQGATHAHV